MTDDEPPHVGRSLARRPDLGLAPFPVWLAMRILGLIGGIILIWWVLSLFFFALGGTTRPSNWVLIVGVLIGTSAKRKNSWEIDLPDFWENLGSLLTSKFCPDCGQSIFDKMPSTGFELEAARHSFWPARICHGCGSDHLKSQASNPTRHDS